MFKSSTEGPDFERTADHDCARSRSPWLPGLVVVQPAGVARVVS